MKAGKRKRSPAKFVRRPSEAEVPGSAKKTQPQPVDTKQQKMALRSSQAARLVRQRFPQGTRVISLAEARGVVERHVPQTNALGGYLVVRWDSGVVGRVTANVVIREETE